MAVRGFYINLDRSVDRRAQIERELAKLSAIGTYQRFAAVDGRASSFRPEIVMRGALGCYLSHLQILRDNVGSTQWLHIIEDDALISQFAAPAIQSVVDNPAYEQFDLVFTNVRIQAYPGHMLQLADTFDRSVEADERGQVLNLKVINAIPLSAYRFFFTTSYLVNPRSIEKVAEALRPGLMTKPLRQIDGVYSDLAQSGALSIACLLPFVTLPRPDADTTIQVGALPWEASMEVMDGMLYAERDVPRLRERLRRLAAAPQYRTLTHEIIGDVYQAVLSGRTP